MKTVDWYFDYLSPYSYLQSERLHELDALAQLNPIPVLFAGLLKHWGTKGPAELATKRRFTIEHIAWLAFQRNVAIRCPSPFPFNPLPLLRLSNVLGNSRPAVLTIFRWVWQGGHSPVDAAAFSQLLRELGVAAGRLEDPAIKERVRADTDAAIARGVFGIPTAIVDDRLFWGDDATGMLFAYLRGDPFFESEPFLAAEKMAPGVGRR